MPFLGSHEELNPQQPSFELAPVDRGKAAWWVIINRDLSQGETLSKFQDFRGMLLRYGDVSGRVSIIVST